MPGPVSDTYEVTTHVHMADCTGNGSEPCWDCGGDGFVCVAEDDDPMGDIEYRCDTCDGKGVVVCPGCEAMRPHAREGDQGRPAV